MKDKENSKNKKRNNKKEIKEKEENGEFLPLNPEEYSKHYYSFTNILYNNKMNYEHDAFKRKYIGQFVLGQKLGQGTFGIVVLGTHQITGEKVAVKILDKDRILQEADKTRIEREIKILKNMRHNNIVHLFDVKETPSSLYIIMEYICGKELFDYIIDKKYLSELEACNFYQQIISGIEYLGKIRVARRDLKPENLLLDEQKNIKIVDFGLSNIYPNNELLITACGSPCYAAPEMINGEPYIGLRVDIWSSGIVLFAMLCGYLPFEDEDNEVLYKKITEGKFKTPKHLSDCCKDFLYKILNVNPNKRYTIEQIKNHPWFNIINPKINMSVGLLLNVYIVPIDEKILEEMVNKLKFNEAEVRANLIANNHNHTTTTYYLLLQKKLREGQKSICDMKSKEFLNYLKNPLNLLSSYDYNLTLIIQLRIKKNKECLEQNNNNNNEINHRTQSGTILNKNKANKLYNKLNSEKQLNLHKKDNKQEIKIKAIFDRKKADMKKRINFKTKTDNNQLFDSKNNSKINKNKNNGKIDKIKKKNEYVSTKENFIQNINSSKSNEIMEMDIPEQETIINETKIKEYKIIFNRKKKESKENHQYSISFENPSIEEKIQNDKNNKEKSQKDKSIDYSDNNISNNINNKIKNKKPLNGVKPRRTITNSIMPKNILENKFKLKIFTDRDTNSSNISKKKVNKLLEKYHTDKSKSKSKSKKKTFKSTRENTDLYINKSINQKRSSNNNKKNQEDKGKGFVKIEELMKRMKKRVINNIKGNSQEPKNNGFKDKIYYLLTDKEKINKGNKNLINGHNINSDNSKDINFREINHKKRIRFKRNITSNNSSKLVQNLMQIKSFQYKEKKDAQLKKELKIEKLKSNERKVREQKEVNERGKYKKKAFIDTSVSFDKSHYGARGRNSTKPKKVSKVQSQKKTININVKNKKNEKNILTTKEVNYIEEDNNSSHYEKNSKNEDEIKRNKNDLKYLKLKSKNKKFVIFKKNGDNNKEIENDLYNNNVDINQNINIDTEKEMMKFKEHINNFKQNENNSIKNYININRNNNNDFDTIVHDDLPSNKTEKVKNEIIKKKIKTLKIQGNLIKKLIIQKNNLYNSLNNSKKHKYIKRALNSNLNYKISSFNNNDENFKTIEDIFSKTYINNSSSRRIFPFSTNMKNRINGNELTKRDNDYKENKDKDEIKPFDLNSIFMNNINGVKGILKDFISSKKWKYKVKKNGYLIYKGENQIDFDINRIANNINLYVIRIAKKEGNSQICKELIKNIVSKLK